MNRSLAVFVGFLITLPAYAYDADDYVTPASVAFVKGAHATLQEKLYNNATTSVAINSAVKTAISASSANASDSHLVTEKAIATALAGKASTAAASYTGGSGIAISSGRVVSVDKGNGLTFTGTGNSAKLAVQSADTTITVGSTGIKVGTITSANIGTSAVLEAAISANAVTNAKIADSAVTLGKIDSSAKINTGDSAFSSLTKLTTEGYVLGAVSELQSALTTENSNSAIDRHVVEDFRNTSYSGTALNSVVATAGAILSEIQQQVDEATGGLQATITAGSGIAKSGSTLSIDKGNGLTFTGTGSSAKLAVQSADTTITVGSTGIKVGTITSANIGASAVTNAKIADSAVTLGKIDSTAKQNASNSLYTSLTKLTTQGYVNEQMAGLANEYQKIMRTESGDADIEAAVINDINNTALDTNTALATMGAIKDQIDSSIAGAGHQVQLKNNAGTPVNINSAVKTAISASANNASDSHLVTEKAIATALAGKQATLTSTNVTTTGTTAGTGAVVTGVSASNGTVTVTRANVQIPVGSSSATNSYATIWIQ